MRRSECEQILASTGSFYEIGKETATNDLSTCGGMETSCRMSLSPRRMTFETSDKTKMTLVQIATNISKCCDDRTTRDLSLLQSTLFTLQNQQLYQMELIEKLQSQLIHPNLRKEKNDIEPEYQNLKKKELSTEVNASGELANM